MIVGPSKPRDEILPADRVPFSEPVDYRGMTISMATLWQDPATKSSSMMIKLSKGADAPHLHTFPYHIVVIEGQVAHKTESIAGSEEIVLGPGSYWYQVANVVHQDICLSDKALVYYVQHGDGDTVWS